MPRTFQSDKGVSFTVPDDATDEQINVAGARAVDEWAKQGGKAGAEAKARQEQMGAIGMAQPQPAPAQQSQPSIDPRFLQQATQAISTLTGKETLDDVAKPVKGILRSMERATGGATAGLMLGGLPGAAGGAALGALGVLPESIVGGGETPALGAAQAVLPSVAGSTVGKIAGQRLAGPVGGIVGSAAGGMGGEYLAQKTGMVPESQLGLALSAIPGAAVETGMAVARARPRVTARGQEALATLENLFTGQRPTLSQVTEARSVDVAESLAEKSILWPQARRKLAAQRQKAEAAAEKLVREVPDKLPGKEIVGGLADAVQDLGKDVKVLAPSTYNEAGRLLQQPGLDPTSPYVKALKSAAEEIEGGLDFARAVGLRSRLLDLARKSASPLASKDERGAVRRLEGVLTSEMRSELKAGGHTVLKDTWETFNQQARLKHTGEELATLIKGTQKPAKAGEAGLMLDAASLHSKIARMRGDVQRGLDKDTLDRFTKFVRVLEVTQKENPSAVVGMVMQLSLDATTLPLFLGWTMTSPKLQKHLTTALQQPSSAVGQRALAQLGRAWLAEQGEAQDKRREGAAYHPPWEPAP